ncbi:MAG: DnaD domain protein [Firmicutes bacterium]|nr:DnaD domain protein [Bacillota bacterium]
MKFLKGGADYSRLSTTVENIFISEYMPGAPGEFVKVYLYGLSLAEAGLEKDEGAMAEDLGITTMDLRKAMVYWEEQQLIKAGPDGGMVFVNLVARPDRSGAKDPAPEALTPEQPAQDEDSFKRVLDHAETILGRPLNVREMQEIEGWIEEIGVSEDMIKKAFDYCQEGGKTGISYISKVVLGWAKEGLETVQDVDNYLEQRSERQGIYRRILNSLGLRRNITEAEKTMIDGWLDTYGFTVEKILDACEKAGFTQSPSIRYVNKVLENWKKEAEDMGRDINSKITVTQGTLNKYYDYLREKAEKEADNRREEIYKKLPEIRDIDINLQSLSSKISRGLLRGVSGEETAKIRKEISDLEKQRAILLTESNYPLDYTDIKHLCDKCSDTGFDENGRRCSCQKIRMGEAELWQNGRLQ